MTEAIDFFKYKALLGELEPLKGKKKPVHDFIKKIYELSNKFRYYEENYKEQPQTARFAFMLVSRALKYDGSARSIKSDIIAKLSSLGGYLVSKKFVTADNVVETYEFSSRSIEFFPKSIKDLDYQLELMQKIPSNKINFKAYYLNEFRPFKYDEAACLIYANNKYGVENNPLRNVIEFSQTEYDDCIETSKNLYNLYNAMKESKWAQ